MVYPNIFKYYLGGFVLRKIFNTHAVPAFLALFCFLTVPFLSVAALPDPTIARLVEQVVQGVNLPAQNPHRGIDDPEHLIPVIPQNVLEDVSRYLIGNSKLNDDFTITKENARDYLNAAKFLDLISDGQETWSTYPLRLECLKKDDNIITLEAFSYRLNPQFFSQYDANGVFLPNKKYELYTSAENELTFVSEWQEMQKSIVNVVVNTVISFSEQIGYDHPHLILFTGTYGSGKSHQVKHHSIMEKIVVDPTAIFSGVLGSDAVKQVYMHMVEGAINAQVHHEGVALRLQILAALMRNHPNLTIIQEAVLSSKQAVLDNVESTIAQGRKLKIVYTDTNLENACLSILTRERGEAVPFFNAIVAGEAQIRAARHFLHQKIEEEDSITGYELIYRDQNTAKIVAKKENGRLIVLPGEEEYFSSLQLPTPPQEIEAIRQRLITSEDTKIYGPQLEKFIGMTVENALLELSK